MADALAVVKVGNSECGLAKLTPWSRIAAMVGAVCGVTISARRPSGTNKMRLRGACAWAVPSCRPRAAQATTSRIFDLNDMRCSPDCLAFIVRWIRARQDSNVTNAGYPQPSPPDPARGITPKALCSSVSSLPIAAKSPAASSRPRAAWASRPSPSIPRPTRTPCMSRWPIPPSPSGRRRPRKAIW